MNSKVLASGIVTVNRWYPVAYRGYPQREIFTGIEQEYDGAGCARDGTATDVYYLE